MPVEELALRLPEPLVLARWSQSLAVLDAILSPRRDFRYFSFDASWGSSERLASMSNGSGDEYSILFSPAGTLVRGFDHESDLSPFVREPMAVQPGLLDTLPGALQPSLIKVASPLWGVPSITVALWRLPEDSSWTAGLPTDSVADDDGGTWLFEQLDGSAASYVAYAREYYERDVDVAAVERISRYSPLREQDVAALNPELNLADLADDLVQIGYPTAR